MSGGSGGAGGTGGGGVGQVPTGRPLNLLWYGPSTTAHSPPSYANYDMPDLVARLCSAHFGEPCSGPGAAAATVSHTSGGTPLLEWMGTAAWGDVASGAPGGGSWDYVIGTTIADVDPERPAGGYASVYQATAATNAAGAAFMNYPVPRPQHDGSTDPDALLTRFECFESIGRAAGGALETPSVGLAIVTAYEYPNAALDARLRQLPGFPSGFPASFSEPLAIYNYDAGIDDNHFTRQGALLVSSAFAAYIYEDLNPIGMDVAEVGPPSCGSASCSMSENQAIYLQAIALDAARRYRSGERPTCSPSDHRDINGMSETAYAQSQLP